MTIKANTVFVMNVMSLIPQFDFTATIPPAPEKIETLPAANEQIIGQFKHCRQCRADAIGLIGQEIPQGASLDGTKRSRCVLLLLSNTVAVDGSGT